MKKIKHIINKRRKAKGEELAPGVPRITNETIAEHREQVLGSARKFIYPLQHSKHRIIIVTTTLFIAAIIAFFTYCTLALYRNQGDSIFLYRVTQVIPFPLARTHGGTFIMYENYLFELRHYIHYFETQQRIDFDSDAGQQQLAEFRRRALDKVINDAYVKKLARENGITVSNQEIDDQIAIVRSQNRLGGDERVLEDVLRDFWNWSLNDFRRSLGQQMLAQKLVAHLDTETNEEATQALAQLSQGREFSEVAAEYSDDIATSENGGEFGFLIDQTNRDFTAQTTDALFRLEPGEISDIINIGFALQIVKTIEKQESRVRGAHILFNFEQVETYVNDRKEREPVRVYLRLPVPELPEEAPLPEQETQE